MYGCDLLIGQQDFQQTADLNALDFVSFYMSLTITGIGLIEC